MSGEELGTLIVVILKARNLIDKHSFYKQDVYCQVVLNGNTQKSEVDVKGGQHPVWDTELRFPIMKDTSDKHRMLEISCWSKESRDDLILGTGKVDITETLKTGEFDDWVQLDIEGVQRGDVYLEMTYFSNAPPPAPKVQVQKPAYAPPPKAATQPLNLQRRPSKWAPSERLARPTSYYPAPGQLKPAGRPAQLAPGGAHLGAPNTNGHSPPSSRSSSHSPTHKPDTLPPLPSDAPARVPTILRPGPKFGPGGPKAHPFASEAPSQYPNPYDDADRKQSLPPNSYDGPRHQLHPSGGVPQPSESRPNPWDGPEHAHYRQSSIGTAAPPQSRPNPYDDPRQPQSRPNPYDDPRQPQQQRRPSETGNLGTTPPQSHTPNPLWADQQGPHNHSAAPPAFPLPNVTVAPATPAPAEGPSPTPTPYNYYSPPANPSYSPSQQSFPPPHAGQQSYPPPQQQQYPPPQQQQQQYPPPQHYTPHPYPPQGYPQQPYGQTPYSPAPYTVPHFQSPPPERNNLPDPYLIARYQTPLPLPPGASSSSPPADAPRQPSPPRQQSPPRRQPSPPRQHLPPREDPHVAELRAAEERARTRREQEQRDMELARKLDLELNLSPIEGEGDSSGRRTTSSGSSPGIPGAW